jgi:multidrug resistance efflux pump
MAAVMADPREQRRRIRRSALVWMAIAAAFYFGFIVLMLVRARR